MSKSPDVAVRCVSQVFLARLKHTKQRVVVKKLCLQGLSTAQRAKTWAEAEVMLSLKVRAASSPAWSQYELWVNLELG